MSSYNRVILIGRIGQDPKFFDNGSNHMCSFSLATSRKEKSLEEGKMEKVTDWHNITAFGNQAKVIEMFNIGKGALVSIEGSIRYKKDKNDDKRIFTNIITSSITILSSKGSDYSGQEQPASSPKEADVLDDDIPF